MRRQVDVREPLQQQEGYDLSRRSYRMRREVISEIEHSAKRLHCSRSKAVNDILMAALRYIRTGDTLTLHELRADITLR